MNAAREARFQKQVRPPKDDGTTSGCSTGQRIVCILKRKPLSTAAIKACRGAHANTAMPKKRSKKNPLAATDKAKNSATSSERVPCENVIAMLKRFKIIADRYRNRRRRFGLRFFLIAAIYNMELKVA